ncbi:D-alanyl-D-alanine carboxypeptidase/D-alanyl-D-alanine-endopeptidase [Streptomyces physcomitrii]|uniref:D-alanyl-D-alanine carboxypeptidase/D-alanyl-D-alanine endopeptidase n=1 Tax=Streptomyces physcomitrii TaxID=2724184 RepID=UPI00379A3A2F
MPELKPRLRPWPSLKQRAASLSGRGHLPFTAAAAVAGLVLSAVLVAAGGPWDSTGQRKAESARAAAEEGAGGADHGRRPAPGGPHSAPSAPPVLDSLGASAHAADAPAGRRLAEVLKPLLSDRALGERRAVSVTDAGSGRELYGKDAGAAFTPASTIKIATGTAVLSAAGPDHRLRTRTVLGPGSRVTLVGGGDPTLTARPRAEGNASLRTLAAATAKELRRRGVGKAELAYDASLFRGERLHPIGRNENLAPVTALMADQGRLDDSTGGTAERAEDPAADAARAFAGFLRAEGVETRGKPAGKRAPKKSEPLASVSSPPLSALVERMLTHSDNDIAEALARQVAVAADRPADFAGAGKAVRAELAALQLPLGGARFADGSGLDRADRLSAKLLTALLTRAADPDRPGLRPVLTGLPVAAFTGTLAHRYDKEGQRQGTGLVRAKTGTLTGVNTLAGSVVDREGRLLVFAFMTSGSTAPGETQAAMDRMASALADCGCR